jgi:predicted MPP superfamily phosphohydrolase
MLFILLNLSFLGSFILIFIYLKLFLNKTNNKDLVKFNKDEKNTMTRRDFIKKSSLVIPIIPLTVSYMGLYEGFSSVKLKKMTFKFKNLPQNFNNMKIAQISDLHLSFFVRLEDLKSIVNKLNEINIDLLLITGDFVDDYVVLDEAVKLVKKVKTKYGVFASPGNHEYYRGIEPVIKAFKKHKLPLLINQGLNIENDGEKIFIAGIDDPYRIDKSEKTKENIKPFLENSLKKALKNYKNEEFKIIMSHRPKLLSVANKYNIDLILSGHTHGGQVGFNGKSLFEPFYPKHFLWGKYQINKTVLYTTSGAGHWFPFRVNCPTEIPIITLKKDI